MYQSYVVCLRDGEGCSWILHRNYLLPISPSLEQSKEDAPMAGVEHTSTSARVPSVDSEPADSDVVSMVDFWMGGVDQRLFGPNAAAQPEKHHRDSGSVWQSHPKNKVTGRAKQ